MTKLRNGSQVTARPTRKATAGTAGYFSESNDSGEPSYPGQDWFNDVVDEIVQAVTAAGVTYDPTKITNLKSTVEALRNANNLNAGTVPLVRLPVTTSATDTTPNKLLKLGDFGIGGMLTVTDTAMNSVRYMSTGSYLSPSALSMTDIPNAGLIGRFFVFVEGNSSYVKQTIMHITYPYRIFFRSAGYAELQAGGLAWSEIIHTGNLKNHTGETVGMIVTFPTLSTPSGYLKLQGGEISRSTYATLFAFAQSSGNMSASEAAKDLGQFGPGNGTTTFTLPNPQGYVIRALDESGSIDAGRVIGSSQHDAFQGHKHSVRTRIGAGGDSNYLSRESGNSSSVTDGAFIDVTSDGMNGAARIANETRMKNIAYPLYIKF